MSGGTGTGPMDLELDDGDTRQHQVADDEAARVEKEFYEAGEQVSDEPEEVEPPHRNLTWLVALAAALIIAVVVGITLSVAGVEDAGIEAESVQVKALPALDEVAAEPLPLTPIVATEKLELDLSSCTPAQITVTDGHLTFDPACAKLVPLP